MGWLLVLGLKECLVECATLCVKSKVMLLILILSHQFKGSTDGLRNDLRPYTIQSKVESHLPFGLEKMTSQELAHAWMATLLRPNSLLAQLRSHAISQGNKD